MQNLNKPVPQFRVSEALECVRKAFDDVYRGPGAVDYTDIIEDARRQYGEELTDATARRRARVAVKAGLLVEVKILRRGKKVTGWVPADVYNDWISQMNLG